MKFRSFGLYIRSICCGFLFGYISGPIPRVNARMREPCLAAPLDFRNLFEIAFSAVGYLMHLHIAGVR